MYSRPVSPLAFAVSLLICLALLPVPYASLFQSAFAQRQDRVPANMGHPQPGKPEGELPDLEDVQRDSLPTSDDVDTNSSYFHSLFNLHCHSLTGE
jgi:hypothetical protein